MLFGKRMTPIIRASVYTKKSLCLGVIAPTGLWEAEPYKSVISAERKGINVLNMKRLKKLIGCN